MSCTEQWLSPGARVERAGARIGAGARVQEAGARTGAGARYQEEGARVQGTEARTRVGSTVVE